MSTRTVLVTGAGRGIGRSIAVRLARSGWRVYGGVRTDVAAKELAAESELITPVELDLTVPEHVAALDRTLPERLDAVVNNVGIAVAGPLETLSRADMHHQFDVNLIGPLALTRAVLPRLRRARGRVVFISSINGRVSFPFTGIYNASKYATEAGPTACGSSCVPSVSRSASWSRASSTPTRGTTWISSSTRSRPASTPSTGRSTRRTSRASASWSGRSAPTPSRPNGSPPPSRAS